MKVIKVILWCDAVAGLEDIFWLLFLVMIISLIIIKLTTRIAFNQLAYMGCGTLIVLIFLYLIATVINKFCFEDASTAHWNAHARFTQAALQAQLQQESRVHVCAPPKMGGAKLNIIYTVGDVPILAARDSVTNNQRITPSSSTTSSAPSVVTTKKDMPPSYEQIVVLPETQSPTHELDKY